MDFGENQKGVQIVRHAADWERTVSALQKAAEELLSKAPALSKEDAEAARLLIVTAHKLAVLTGTL